MAPTLGVGERPLGPARWGWVGTPDLYRAILEGTPYPLRAMIGFGANALLAPANGRHGREALRALDFYAPLDLFMTPTAELADVVLPVASAFEREGLKLGFEISQETQSLIQLRPAVVPPAGEARADTDIIFDLAGRPGLGAQFWDGVIDAAYRPQAAPDRVPPGQLHPAPRGRRAPAEAPPRQACRGGRERGPARLRHAVTQGRDLFADVPRSRLRALARVLGAAGRPGGAAGLGRALSPSPHERKVVGVLRDAAPRVAEPAQARP